MTRKPSSPSPRTSIPAVSSTWGTRPNNSSGGRGRTIWAISIILQSHLSCIMTATLVGWSATLSALLLTPCQGLANKCMAAPDLTATQRESFDWLKGGLPAYPSSRLTSLALDGGSVRPWALSLTPSIGLWLKSYGSAAGVLHMQAGESWAKASQDNDQSHHSLVSCIFILPWLKDYGLS